MIAYYKPEDSVTETDNACGQCHRNRQCLRTASQKTMPADSVTETDNANSFSLSTESPFLEIDADRKLIPLVSALQQVHTRFYKLDDV